MNDFSNSFFVILLLLFSSCQKENEMEVPVPSSNPASIRQQISVIEDEVAGVPVVIAGQVSLLDKEGGTLSGIPENRLDWNFAVAFQRVLNGTLLSFLPVEDRLPAILKDQEGNVWNIFGEAIEGPRTGEQLVPANAGIGYWFVFGSMYPGANIHEGPSRKVDVQHTSLEGWTIPTQTVFQGAGFDGIPALDNPAFIRPPAQKSDQEPFFLSDNDLIIGITVNGESRAYPHKLMDYHEIVNDVVGGVPVTVTYCPLTGTAKVWDRSTMPRETFGVSGLLYDSNVLPFDRSTRSIWTQLEGECVFGDRVGERLPLLHHIETTWAVWLQMIHAPQVLSPETGFDRRYSEYPYGDYRNNHDLLLVPVVYDDDRIPRKERVFAVLVNGTAKVYRKSAFF